MNKTDMYGCPNFCEDNSYNQCNENEILWPAELDENCCTTKQVCIDPFVPGSSMNAFGNGSTSYLECGCPDLTECPANTMKCPLFKLENPFTGDDCYFGSACLPPPSPFLGHCETGCPTVCGANETYCDLGTDDQGCPLKGICVPYTGLDECSVCPPISCGGNTKVCGAVTDANGQSSGCSPETCSLPAAGMCPDETICSPDCPEDHIPCYAPSNAPATCPQTVKSCLPAIDPTDSCPNFCPVFCDPNAEKACNGGIIPETMCTGSDYCV